MLKKIGLLLLLLLSVVTALFAYLHDLGAGKDGNLQIEPINPVVPISRTVSKKEHETEILFGDLHVHTDYSADAALFNLPALSGFGGTTPADACNYARYCSAIDFWSINDHSEDLTPTTWRNTVEAIDACNAATDPERPDLVSFLGWEWSQRSDDVNSHYGHKNVILREYKQGRIPTRPIAAHENSFVSNFPQAMRGYLQLGQSQEYADFNAYVTAASAVPTCQTGVDVKDLPLDCQEVAYTPTELYEKLDQWGFDNLIIPHGLSWGTTNPEGSDLKNQLVEHDPNRQRLLEVYSGHGSSERFVEMKDFIKDSSGAVTCPESTDDYTPCCQQAGKLAKAQCADSSDSTCLMNIADAQINVANMYANNKKVSIEDIGGKNMNDWGQCGQLQTFMPSVNYRAKQSAQYAYTVNGEIDKSTLAARSKVDEEDTANEQSREKAIEKPTRFRFGLIGSSDNHKARAGNGFKEGNRLMITDSKDVGVVKNQLLRSFTSKREGSFYYSGGLVAAHSKGRNRDAVWQALHNRNVYGTSGDRIMLWFDLVNSPDGKVAMGSEVSMQQAPKFQVKALGAFEQIPGCPDYAKDALGIEGINSLCGGECYNPADTRKKISRIEVIRNHPQQAENESISGLIEDPWKTFTCPDNDDGCVVEFEDKEFESNQREVLYYVRAIQAPSLAVNGDPFHCELDDEGNCTKVNYCSGPHAAERDQDCLDMAEERAWSSPIFIDVKSDTNIGNVKETNDALSDKP